MKSNQLQLHTPLIIENLNEFLEKTKDFRELTALLRLNYDGEQQKTRLIEYFRSIFWNRIIIYANAYNRFGIQDAEFPEFLFEELLKLLARGETTLLLQNFEKLLEILGASYFKDASHGEIDKIGGLQTHGLKINSEEWRLRNVLNSLEDLDRLAYLLIRLQEIPILNRDQESRLAIEIEAGVLAEEVLSSQTKLLDHQLQDYEEIAERGRSSFQLLWISNLYLAFDAALNQSLEGLTFLEIFQEGCIGLNRAIQKYDYKHGARFSTYASWWIRQSIHRSNSEVSSLIRFPQHRVDEINSLVRYLDASNQDLSEIVNDEQSILAISKELEMPVATIKSILETRFLFLSFANFELASINPFDTQFGSRSFDSSTLDPASVLEAMDLNLQLNKLLCALDERSARVIKLRFGLLSEPKTLQEIADVMGVTRERIRQIEAKALELLAGLADALDLRIFLTGEYCSVFD
jgi:RNA polymerase sigma factor (sigma-70 family)